MRFARIDICGVQRGDVTVAAVLAQECAPVPQRDMRFGGPGQIVVCRKQRTTKRIATVRGLQHESGRAHDCRCVDVEVTRERSPCAALTCRDRVGRFRDVPDRGNRARDEERTLLPMPA